jgi:serine/threonine-protein kinase PknG
VPGAAPASARTASAAAATRRRGGTTRASGTTRSRLGAGLVEVPSIAFRDPASAVLAEPMLAENRRFCARCDQPVGRSRSDTPGRTEGFCPSCGAPFSFRPKLESGDVLGGQYEVAGCLAHGGMGWIYLARDRNVSDRWVVLKGLLNTADDGAMAAALAERRFLAEVEHPNIVKIFNFVQHGDSGYIVMEYVGGRSLREIVAESRSSDGTSGEPIPLQRAIAYALEVLPALGYLHSAGLLFCDFKLDNVIQTQHSLKLIDLGGVYRMDDRSSPVFGTVGYQAPEIAETGPTVPSDLFTVARALAVMSFEFRGYQSTFRYELPPREEVPVLRGCDSFYRFLLKGTAPHPDDRFQSAEEMADQLLGVLCEVVAAADGKSVPRAGRLFTGELRAAGDRPDWTLLPLLQVAADDPAAGYLAALAAADAEELVPLLDAAPVQTVEVDLRRVRARIDAGDLGGARALADRIEAADPWEWRAAWYHGLAALADDRPGEATAAFATVYHAVPGELAPKLAMAVALETAGDPEQAAGWFDVVSRTDAAYTSASFGLAHCLATTGDTAGALAAYSRVPESSSAYQDAQVERIRLLLQDDQHGTGGAGVLAAAKCFDTLPLGDGRRLRLTCEILEAGVDVVERDGSDVDADTLLLGHRMQSRDLRLALEHAYRERGRQAQAREERIRSADEANRVRPWTWR